MPDGSELLNGRRVLVVEDEYFIADDMRRVFEENGAQVIGPVGSIDDALAIIDETPRIDGAVLDINLREVMVFPVADALRARGVPFVFATGYEENAVPKRLRDAIHCEKPIEPVRLAKALFGRPVAC
ncbi:response regulator [Methylorubrum rhodesianum]|jgi:CheY-like chemotaxis protein|uniref:Response regulator n=1 Tax=Methylorubrum rhodesianum TaxID=29427 RepID=A0ABU9ZB74_9HYPH|nr:MULTISPECIES: response regulator [Methylorubrum]MBY0143989.1 response regulator [Methylorubrum populi]MRI55987.1 response regulator [Methylobacterium sp. DB1607]MBB5765221.1 CheY-like chemotaxis protein [Methylorubrum rhodesianum]MBI1691302.1 response regulator [Methylorubrum sp. DB1722]MBK3405854.1 response regulator [Methylorubrum rhodesianum]